MTNKSSLNALCKSDFEEAISDDAQTIHRKQRGAGDNPQEYASPTPSVSFAMRTVLKIYSASDTGGFIL